MEKLSSPANGPSESPARNDPTIWGRWWIRILLFIIHLTLLVAALSLAPSAYAFKSGEILGGPTILSSLLLWVFLWFVRKRSTILLFCVLVLAQTGLIAVVTSQFRREDRALQGAVADMAQRQKVWETQMANFHVERIFEILNPENEFHSEELPGLLERAHAASATNTQYWVWMETSVNDTEKRLATVSRRLASEFRRGFESRRVRNQRLQELNTNYLIEIEQLITLLIDVKGHYQSTKGRLMFDRQQDLDAFNQRFSSLKAIQTKIEDETAFRFPTIKLSSTEWKSRHSTRFCLECVEIRGHGNRPQNMRSLGRARVPLVPPSYC